VKYVTVYLSRLDLGHCMASDVSHCVCLEMLQKQGKKLRREGKDRWVDFTGKVIT